MSKNSIPRKYNPSHGKYKHGYSSHPLFRTWQRMMDVCYNPNRPRYKSNGGRGIKVHEEWHDVESFIKDVGDKPSDEHFFTRIDISKDYSPSNCEWSKSISRGDNLKVLHEKTGLSNTPEYNTWKNMRARCNRKSSKHYDTYGGRGIKVCDRWQHSFKNFISDVGFKPSPSHSLDRIDNNGDYTPENCRWATPKEQSMNKRSNVKIKYRGKMITYDEAIKMSGLTYKVLNARIKSLGWDVEKAIHTPLMNRGRKKSS